MKRLVKQVRFSLARMLGYRYIVNLRTREIHRLGSKYSQCHLPGIKKYWLVREKHLPALLKFGCDGCRFCMPEFDTDGRTADDSEPEIYFV